MSGKKFKLRRGRTFRIAVRAGAVLFCVLVLYVAIGCRATQVNIIGNYHESEEAIQRYLGTRPFSGNSVMLFLFNRHRKIGGNTFVDTITADLESPNVVNIKVNEKSLIGSVLYDGKYWYFNRSGVVLVSSDTNAESKETVSRVSDAIEMASSYQYLLSGHMINLASDSVIYGAEYGDGGDEGTGEDEDMEDAPEEYSEEDPEEYTEEVPEENTEDQQGGAETEDGTGETADLVIEPVIVSDEAGSSESDNGGTDQSEKIDTSARGGNYIPLVRGLVFSEAALGYPLPVQFENVFTSIAILKSFIDRSGYVPDDVMFDEDGDLVVTYGEAAINLGKGENIEQRVSVIGEALSSIAGLKGVLHLENYDGTRNRLIFSKNEKNS